MTGTYNVIEFSCHVRELLRNLYFHQHIVKKNFNPLSKPHKLLHYHKPSGVHAITRSTHTSVLEKSRSCTATRAFTQSSFASSRPQKALVYLYKYIAVSPKGSERQNERSLNRRHSSPLTPRLRRSRTGKRAISARKSFGKLLAIIPWQTMFTRTGYV